MPDTITEPASPTTSEIFATTMRDVRELADAELQLARHELRHEAASARRAGIELAVAFGCVVLAVSSLVTSLAIARRSATLELVLSGVFLIVAAAAAVLGMRARPHAPLRPTRERISSDIDRVKEHLS